MSLLVLGLSHRTAPLSLLDEVSRAAGEPLLIEISTLGSVGEALVLATCNRLEVVASVPQFHPAVDDLMALLASASGVPLAQMRPHLLLHHADRAVEHLFLTASGLDSMLVGESQIRFQLRTALARARDAGTVGPALSELVEAALRVGKRVQTETQLDHAGRSLADEGLAALADAGVPSDGAQVLVLGAGSMASVAAVAARRAGAHDVVVVNRDAARGDRLARAVDGRAAGWDRLADEIGACDVLVACTGAAGVLVHTDTPGLAGRRRPLGVLDLAMPHDVDPRVADLPGVSLVGLPDLARRLATTPDDPVAAALQRARAIVADEVETFAATQAANEVAPTVVALRRQAEQVVAAELSRFTARLGGELDPRVAAEAGALVRRVVGKLLHTPTVRVKAAARGPGGSDYEAALRHLFALDAGATAAVSTPELDEQEGP
jgi:glutamyl-tRNA reductase